MVETMRWPKASPSVLSTVDGQDAEARRGIAIDRHVEARAGVFLVRGDIGDLRQAFELVEKDCRPVIELVRVGIGQRILILGLGHAAADGDVLCSLHVQRDALDLGQLRLQPFDNLIACWRCAARAVSAQ